ncbi:MAG: hypothetical protein JWM97_3131 [Phycisphaerales bacterium]|nr:hypothetical protein [Phycisphaerales bacterium]MDB5305582.1 hypothetical protein [Phycisphaerales bacterium]
MMLTPKTFARVRTCVLDLRQNGIDLNAADDRMIREVVHEYLDYFQLMLGADPNVRQVYCLVKRETYMHPAGQ